MAAFGCDMAPPVAQGHVLTDSRQRTWSVGRPVGAGGFGAIYLCDRGDEKTGEEADYVVKIEPHSNGPLFVEMHVFLRIGQDHQVASWTPRQSDKPPGWVGIPRFHGSGSTVVQGQKLRFVIMTRFGSDIEKFFQSGKKPVPLATVLNIGLQVLNSLEYIHSKGYTHNDVKAQNLLLDRSGGGCDVFLVDFGLASKYRNSLGFHHDGGEDERFAHEGTLEYTSRDGHIGAHSRRGDLETLGYNLVHWNSGFLPWRNTEDPKQIQIQKNGFLENVDTFLKKCFKPASYPEVLLKFFDYVCQLEFKAKPDYKKLRRILGAALDELGSEPYSKLEFGKKIKIRKSRQSDIMPMIREELAPGRATRSQDDSQKVFWQDILDPESIMKNASKSNMEDDSNSRDPRRDAAEQEREKASLENPTPEMWRIITMRRSQEEERERLGWRDQLEVFQKRSAALKAKIAAMDLTPRHNTPVMEEVIARRAERLAAGHGQHTPEPSDEEEEMVEEEVDGVRKGPGVTFRPGDVMTPVQKTSTRRLRSQASSSSSKARKSSIKTRSRPSTPEEEEAMDTEEAGEVFSRTPEDPRLRAKTTCQTEPVRRTRRCRQEPLIGREPAQSERESRSVDQSEPRMMRSCRATPPLSLLPTPSDTAPPSPPLLSSRHAACPVCNKILLEKSLPRHLASVHKMSPALTNEKSGVMTAGQSEASTPQRRSGRKRSSPNVIDQDQEPRRPRTGGADHSEVRTRVMDSPSQNLRVTGCPLCGLQMPKSLIPKHFQDLHSPSNSRRTRRQQSESDSMMTDSPLTRFSCGKARVNVSQDSPEKIVNVETRAVLSRDAERTIVDTLKRGLVL